MVFIFVETSEAKTNEPAARICKWLAGYKISSYEKKYSDRHRPISHREHPKVALSNGHVGTVVPRLLIE